MYRIVGYASHTIVQAATQIQSGNYLLQCARRGQRDNFLAVLDAAPDVVPIEEDRINQ
jgi:hypothetical protein